ncbi:hypothetical protein CDL15_Pgr006457 [Punica granatum]|uniref:Uncharacterized protein n=1 Tax=Punica granatum TaxID=22663 RepID=A0A218XZR1_PUNGR|nr:hypothetical protein CDL15_Pgr006457 [Punica granatum]
MHARVLSRRPDARSRTYSHARRSPARSIAAPDARARPRLLTRMSAHARAPHDAPCVCLTFALQRTPAYVPRARPCSSSPEARARAPEHPSTCPAESPYSPALPRLFPHILRLGITFPT